LIKVGYGPYGDPVVSAP